MSWRTPLSIHVMYARPRATDRRWQVVSYAPPPGDVAQLIPPLLFVGRVYWGDQHPGHIAAPWYLRWYVMLRHDQWMAQEERAA